MKVGEKRPCLTCPEPRAPGASYCKPCSALKSWAYRQGNPFKIQRYHKNPGLAALHKMAIYRPEGTNDNNSEGG